MMSRLREIATSRDTLILEEREKQAAVAAPGTGPQPSVSMPLPAAE
jgi:hypothetical protein